MIAVGDVVVWLGEPPDNNPYSWPRRAVSSIIGPERAAALLAFKDNRPTSEYTFWHVPYRGSPQRLTSPDEVAW